jgi:Suppressor of fused protein (SUFU)
MKGPPWPLEAAPRTTLESYLSWLDEQAGVPGVYEYVSEPAGDDQPVLSIRYMDCPQPGTLLGFTFGISAVANPLWGGLRPELAICVDSGDARWAWALADIGDRVRTTSVFLPGDTIEIGEPISAESPMESFVLWHQLISDDDTVFRVGDHEVVLVQAIPLHQSELETLRRHPDRFVAVRDFLGQLAAEGLAITDVHRPPLRSEDPVGEPGPT